MTRRHLLSRLAGAVAAVCAWPVAVKPPEPKWRVAFFESNKRLRGADVDCVIMDEYSPNDLPARLATNAERLAAEHWNAKITRKGDV